MKKEAPEFERIVARQKRRGFPRPRCRNRGVVAEEQGRRGAAVERRLRGRRNRFGLALRRFRVDKAKKSRYTEIARKNGSSRRSYGITITPETLPADV
jgi:hypothetical protein